MKQHFLSLRRSAHTPSSRSISCAGLSKSAGGSSRPSALLLKRGRCVQPSSSASAPCAANQSASFRQAVALHQLLWFSLRSIGQHHRQESALRSVKSGLDSSSFLSIPAAPCALAAMTCKERHSAPTLCKRPAASPPPRRSPEQWRPKSTEPGQRSAVDERLRTAVRAACASRNRAVTTRLFSPL